MKVKKFDNKYIMGIILVVSFLVFLYTLKLIFPSFIVGVAEIEPVVKFGNFIDSNFFTYQIYNFITTTYVMYFYTSACCRKSKLDKIEIIIILICNLILTIFNLLIPNLYFVINLISLLLIPIIIMLKNKTLIKGNILSLVICFIIHNISQILSLGIRDIGSMIVSNNSATFTILLLDVYIWEYLLYRIFGKEKC